MATRSCKRSASPIPSRLLKKAVQMTLCRRRDWQGYTGDKIAGATGADIKLRAERKLGGRA